LISCDTTSKSSNLGAIVPKGIILEAVFAIVYLSLFYIHLSIQGSLLQNQYAELSAVFQHPSRHCILAPE